MDRLRHSPVEAIHHDGPTGLPRRLLRHLIVSHGIGVGSRVLDAGCGSGELSGYLSLLGIDVTGLDSSPVAIAAARRAVPNLDFHLIHSEHDVPPSERPFDLVIIRDWSFYGHSLASRETFGTTARLLSGLRPGGTLAFLTVTGDPQERSEHTTACYLRHLACFPGEVASALFQNGILQQFVPEWLSPRRSSIGHLVTEIRIPPLPVERSEWLRHAESAARAGDQPCCRHSDRSAVPNIPARAA